MPAGNSSISKRERRRAFRLAYLNGALWSLGNGLASTSLLVYMIKQLGASETAVGVILAAPHLVGALRIGAPTLVGRAGSRKNLCLVAYGLSAILLAAISQLAEPRQLASPSMSLSYIVVLWCLYHLLEYIGTVYLWAWLGDLAPRRIRGRFIGQRERWMLVGRIVGMLGGGAFSYYWLNTGLSANLFRWMAYALPTCLGAGLMMAAIVPLLKMPEPQAERPAPPPLAETIRSALRPLADANMLWLLAFGAWFSLANGLTQAAQYSFPIAVFGLSLFMRQMLEATMRGAQAFAAPQVGHLADRLGNRGLLIEAQLIVALAPLSLFLASQSAPQPIAYADGSSWWMYDNVSMWLNHGGIFLCATWAFFIAYVGLNVGLPNLMLKLAAPSDRASYIAWYFALTGVVYGICTIAGGALYEKLKASQPEFDLGIVSLDYNEMLFLAGFILRATAVVWLLPIVEPLRSRQAVSPR